MVLPVQPGHCDSMRLRWVCFLFRSNSAIADSCLGFIGRRSLNAGKCSFCKFLQSPEPRFGSIGQGSYCPRKTTGCELASMQSVAAHFVVQCTDTDSQRLGSFLAMQVASFQCHCDGFAFTDFHSFG